MRWGLPDGLRVSSFAVIAAVLVLNACTTRRSGLNVAPPKVYNDAETRRSLAQQSERVLGAARDIDVKTLQQLAVLRQMQEATFRGGFSGIVPPPGLTPTAVPVPTVPAPTASNLPAAPATPTNGFGALVTESLDDYAGKEAEIENLRLLYAADTRIAGRNARLYLVRFDIMLNPSRQNYASYLWRPFDCFHLDNELLPQCRGLRNYMEDYQAVVWFDLPTLPGEGEQPRRRAPVEVYAVQPTNQTLTTLDSMTSARALELAAAAVWNGMAGQGEYETRSEEQFAEQRKFPIIQGIVDSPTRFHFVFNPRRHTVRRSAFISWIPGVGRYSTSLSLDSGVRRAYAYLLVRDPDSLEADLQRLDPANLSSCNALICASSPAHPTGHTNQAAAAADPSGADGSVQPTPTPQPAVSYALGSFVYEERFLEESALQVDVPAQPAPTAIHSPGSEASPATPDLVLPIVVRGRYVRYGNPYRNDPLFFEQPDYPPRLHEGQCERHDDDSGSRVLAVRLPIETRRDGIQTAQWTVSASPNDHLFAFRSCGDVDWRHVTVQPFFCDRNGNACTAGNSALIYRGLAHPTCVSGESDCRMPSGGPSGCEGALYELNPLPPKPQDGISLRFHVDAGTARGWTSSVPYDGPWAAPPTPTATATPK